MDYQIIIIYCLIDDFLKSNGQIRKCQSKVSDAEIMTTAIVASSFFHCNLTLARRFMKSFGYIPKMISKSQFNRRLHRLSDELEQLIRFLQQVFVTRNESKVFLIDSFPIAVCDNIRISRCKIYHCEKYRGYIASKRRYFYGLRLHLMITAQGEPVDFFLSPGSMADVNALRVYQFDLPSGSRIYGDGAFNHYLVEDLLEEHDVFLRPIRKKDSKRLIDPPEQYSQHYHRQFVETAGSSINRLMPKSIHSVTSKGFELKILLFVLAYAFTFIL